MRGTRLDFMTQTVTRSNLARSLDRSLIVIACAGILLAFIEVALLPINGPLGHILILFPLVFLAFLAGGLRAWHRRPGNRMGALILMGGGAVFLGGLGNTDFPLLIAAGQLSASLILAVTVHMLHAFPSGRLHGRISQAIVVLAYVNSLILQIPRYLFAADDPALLLAIADNPALVLGAAVMQRWVGTAVMVATALVLMYRLRCAGPEQRRVLAPLFAYGAFAVIFVPLGTQILSPVLGITPEVRAGLQLLVMGGIPIAFAHGVQRGGFAKTGELEELGAWLGSSGGPKSALVGALSRALGDPSVTLSYWVPRQGIFVDDDGHPLPLEPPGSSRGMMEIELDSRTVGAISYDATLIEEPELVRAAGQVVAIAVDRERLTAQLRESNGALQRSRERLVDTADRERRRIARDLHDGLQMRLVLLALEAQQLSHAHDAATAKERATHLRQGIDSAAAELRQLVHAVMPAALIERGLAAAAEDLADRMPIPTTLVLELEDGSCTSAVERTAYFVLAEALSNVLKHAEATQIQVNLSMREGWLRLEVCDNGTGGADLHQGTGLRGIEDRADVLGGSFALETTPGQGTRITVELPCA